jgi:hypothetical protein
MCIQINGMSPARDGCPPHPSSSFLSSSALPQYASARNAQSTHATSEIPSQYPSAMLNESRKANSMTPICRLPDELLVLILRELQIKPDRSEWQPDFDFHNFDGFNSDWIRMTWVCQHMRDVAISSPELWTFLTYTHTAAWNALVVSRARQIELCIDIAHRYARGATTSATYLYKAQHARVMFSNSIFVMLLRDAPFLTILHVHELRSPIEATSFPVHSPLVNQLVELRVSESDIRSWPRLAWPQLRRFGLHDLHIDPDRFATMLLGMPRLETLSLIRIVPSKWHYYDLQTTDIPSSSLPSLRCLRKVSIHADIRHSVLALLERILRTTHEDHHPGLNLKLQGTAELDLVLAHLVNAWRWSPLPPLTLFIDRHTYPYSLALGLKRSDRYQGNSATPTSSANTLESSTFHITLPHLRDDNDEMFRQYLLAITTLNVDGAGRSIRKNFLHRLEDLLSPESCPNIVSIIFRNMHDAQVLVHGSKCCVAHPIAQYGTSCMRTVPIRTT